MIHISINGQQYGPYPAEQVNQMLASGQVQPHEMSWMEGMAEWAPLSSMPGISVPAVLPPPPRPVRSQYQPLPPRKISLLAVAAMLAGLSSLPLFFVISMKAGILALLGIVLGHLSVALIKQPHRRLTGIGMGVAGLVTGYLFIAMIVAGMIWAANHLSKFGGLLR